MRFNRDVLANGLRAGTPIKDLANRAVGKTTAAVFAAIAASYAAPGEWVRVEDPDDDTYAKRINILGRVLATLDRQRLRGIEVEERRYAVYPDDGRAQFEAVQSMTATTYSGVFVRNTFAEAV